MSTGRAVTSDFARRRFVEVVLPHLDEAYRLARWLTGNGDRRGRRRAGRLRQGACIARTRPSSDIRAHGS